METWVISNERSLIGVVEEPLFPFQRPAEANDPAEQAVVVRVRGVSESRCEMVIEFVLRWSGKRGIRNFETEAAQARGNDEEEQGVVGDSLREKIRKPLVDEVLTGQHGFCFITAGAHSRVKNSRPSS